MDETMSNNGRRPENEPGGNLARALVWIGVAGVAAAIALSVARALIPKRPGDPTTERIQQLIDEANQLLKTLDEKRS